MKQSSKGRKMRHRTAIFTLAMMSVFALGACERAEEDDLDQEIESINAIDEANLNELMLTVSDPEEAVSYFARSSAQQPDRVDFKRGLAKSLVRAGRPADAVPVWR